MTQWTFPYHYHHGAEEWLYVVAGTPTLRDPDGERLLAPGDLVCFPSGPSGAHAVRGPGRVVMFSAGGSGASISVYPDSDKLGVRPPGGGEDRLNFRRRDAVDYWEDQ
ncbi:MAG: cupin domain-containing protein [Solirubrobacteraceae bacterium]